MDYQFTVYHYNYETGVKTEGVFKSYDDAQSFMNKFDGHTALGAGPGTKVYGVFESSFNLVATMEAYNDGEKGRD